MDEKNAYGFSVEGFGKEDAEALLRKLHEDEEAAPAAPKKRPRPRPAAYKREQRYKRRCAKHLPALPTASHFSLDGSEYRYSYKRGCKAPHKHEDLFTRENAYIRREYHTHRLLVQNSNKSKREFKAMASRKARRAPYESTPAKSRRLYRKLFDLEWYIGP